MQLTPVNSSALKAIGYDAQNSELHVEFHSGDKYVYPGVTPEQHAALASAGSIGAHFQKHVRPQFTGRKL